ncbi:toll-like receptor 8 [Diadema antillarum]|uniref:toll-like receptor 8 n=1 Tax=Diadema antillarum TaxID=105358 RepID=UPI003A8A0187
MTPQTIGKVIPHLRTVFISNNNLVEIPPRAFASLPDLFYLDLSFNSIRHIDSEAFSGLELLEYILLQFNNLIDAFNVNVFHNLPALTVLDVSDSNINGLDPLRSFSGLSNLEELFLARNQLHPSDLWDTKKNVSVFRDMRSLQTLDLTGTNLKDEIPSWGFDGLSQLRRLYLQDVGLVTLPTELFRSLRYLDTLSLDDNYFEELPNLIFENTPRLGSLYLGRNQLSRLPPMLFKNTTNLYKLDLTRTRIGIIPEQVISPIRESITSLDLSHNSLSCYCQNEWLRIWVHENYDKVFLSDTNCSDNSPAELVGHSFLDFQPILVCRPRVLLYACIAISGVAIVFTGIIIYYNRWWIKYKLFLLKLCIIGYREIIDDDEYHYDINIVFHDDDEEWVIDRMVPVVRENYPEAVLCVGDDDLRAGLLRLDAVADVIENSYKSVFVISYAAIDSPWYVTKLRLALQHMNHSQRDAILLVFLENIADDRLPYIIRLLLGVNRPFLRWSSDIQQEECFWDHFMKCVKKQSF